MQAVLFAQDPDEAAILSVVLQRAGFAVRQQRDAERIFQLWPEQPCDLALLALRRAASISQLASWLGQLHTQAEIPVVLVTDALDEDAQVALLESGADLLVFRPYSARLLIAQIRSLVRRPGGMPLAGLPALDVCGLQLDPAAHTVCAEGGSPVRLTQLEFRLLYTFMTHPGQVLPSETLVERVWGYNGQGDRDLVRGLIKRLRAKVEPDPQSPVYIRTVPGVGYVFQD